MATYIGSLRVSRRLGKSCWMMANTIAELQTMAIRLGLPLRWMKQGPPRFELTEGQRRAALWAGAIPCTHMDMVRFGTLGIQPGTPGYHPTHGPGDRRGVAA